MEERIRLAGLGLCNKVLVLNDDGNATHIHNVVYVAFPSLQLSGGYTFMVSSGKSLIPIQIPKGGLSVHYLSSIIKRGTLYLRPLQKDVDVSHITKDHCDKVSITACLTF